MSLKITYTLEDFDKDKIINKYEMQDGGKAQLFLANTCFIRMQKYVPFREGLLSTTATIRPGSVTYEQPYAHKQYTSNKGKGIRGKQWDKKMVNNEKSLIISEMEAFLKKTKGNK